MDALKTAGVSIFSIGDRSKIKMLVGDRAHLGRLSPKVRLDVLRRLSDS